MELKTLFYQAIRALLDAASQGWHLSQGVYPAPGCLAPRMYIDLHVHTYRQRELKWTDMEGVAEAHFVPQHTG